MTQSPSLPGPEELVGRLFEAGVAALDLLTIYLGEKLGFYATLATTGPTTVDELAAASGTHPRYVREWLEQQATTQLLAVDDPALPADKRRYSLPEGYDAVLVDNQSEAFVAPLGRFLAAAGAMTPRLVEAYRTGAGIDWEEYGEDARTGQADFNRPFFLNSLVDGYLKQIPGLDERLSQPGARVAEIGPGGGFALIATARAYPGLRADGFDIDAPTIAMATANIAEAGLADRVSVHHADAGAVDGNGAYDLVAAYECIHDMSDPVAVLGAMRKLAKPGGTVLVMDEGVGEEFGDFGNLVERLMYAASLLFCLPNGLAAQPSAATGTVMRPATLKSYALDAGFSGVEILPLEHDLFRFYRLVP